MSYYDLFNIPPSQPTDTLGIGVFDGIHLGHQHLLKNCDALLTFTPHPKQILQPQQFKGCLTPLEEKKKHFENIIAITFDRSFSMLSADKFLEIIHTMINPSKVVVGYDFYFGKKRQGTTEHLKAWGNQTHRSIEIMSPFQYKGVTVKSSYIRDLLSNGDIKEANQFLGYRYSLTGMVIQGKQRGQLLGYPTANLVISPNKLLPRKGVYAGVVQFSNIEYPCAISIGNNPTFNNQNISVEVHIIGFRGDLYGQTMTVNLTQFLRHQFSFQSETALIKQIKKDIDIVLKKTL